MNDKPAGANPVDVSVGRMPPERVNPAIAEAVERLRHVDRAIWDDVESALLEAREGHQDAEVDELDCTLLLDLIWLYRHAEPLLTNKAAVSNAARRAEAQMIIEAPAMLSLLKRIRRGDLHQRVRYLYDEASAVIGRIER